MDENPRRCREITSICHPDKMTLDEWCDEAIHNIEGMRTCRFLIDKVLWPEDWVLTFAGFSEMDKEDCDGR